MKILSNLKVKYQVSILVSILIIFQIMIFYISYANLLDLNKTLTTVFGTRLPAIDNLIQADRDFQQSLVAERTLLLSSLGQKDISTQAKDYLKNRDQVIERFNTYTKLASTESEKKEISLFKKSYEKWKTQSDSTLMITENGITGDSSDNIKKSLNELAPLFENSRDSLDKLQEIILADTKKEYDESIQEFNTTKKAVLTLLGASVIFSIAFSIFIIVMINKLISKALNTLDSENRELNKISDDLATRAQALASASIEQSSSVTETSSSLTRISQMVKTNTENAVSSNETVNDSQKKLNNAISMITNLAELVEKINQATLELTSRVNNSHSKFNEILSVFNEIQSKTSVINDIVFQTKLLSFNASVEAARAAEHGKGFAVVAEEVGNLAHMSGNSADEISTLLNTSLEEINKIISTSEQEVNSALSVNEKTVKDSLEISTKCEAVLKDVEEMFRIVSTTSNKIADASKEQSMGVEEINNAVQQINTVNQGTTESASDIESRSDKLLKVVDNINLSINDLKKLV